MKNFLILLLTLYPKLILANPACTVCTFALGASLGIARKLGLQDSVVGLWAGALLTILGYWTIKFFDKHNWNFYGRDKIIIFLSVSMIGFIYLGDITYIPSVIWYIFFMDPILFSSILGMLIFIYSQKFYQWMKKKNNGHAHFPFEKVVLPVALLLIMSIYLTYFPI